MKVVTSADQILANLAELERGRSSASESLRNAHRQLIRRGTCFLSYQSSEGIGFAPSRFVGYMNNKLASHTANPNRDGRVTNAALTAILEVPPSPDADLEKRYLAFCDLIGVSPSKTGTFGVPRKYWASSDVLELLDQEEVAAITA
jgi:putative restriction endonuclease